MKTPYSKRNHHKIKKGGSSKKCMYKYIDETHYTMEGECPGLKYLNEIRDTVRDQDPNSVYMAFGHGCDLEGEEQDVPEHCEYYTMVACGMASDNTYKKIQEDFFNNTLDLNNPVKYNFKGESRNDAKYSSIFTTGIESLYRRTSTDTYVNNKINPLLDIGRYSGLRKMGDIISDNMFMTPRYPPNFINSKDPNNRNSEIVRPITLEMYYLQHFVGSVFPTTYQVCKLLHENFPKSILNSFKYPLLDAKYHNKFKQLISNNFSIDYASIMNVFNGIHINPACRLICKGPNTVEEILVPEESFVGIRRNKSSKLDSLTWDPALMDPN
jgi:hypothetical protein